MTWRSPSWHNGRGSAMTETLKMLVAVPEKLEVALDREAVKLGLTRNQVLLKIACDHFGLKFAPRGRGAPVRPKIENSK